MIRYIEYQTIKYCILVLGSSTILIRPHLLSYRGKIKVAYQGPRVKLARNEKLGND